MGDSTQIIQNISDTALWIAAYRARESRRENALFHDPLAQELAGERGERIIRSLWGGGRMDWALAVRTRLLDDMILEAVRNRQVDRVVNLACGLDTRPYRLSLPLQLEWVELDLPGIIRFKTTRLASHRPICRLERIEADLSVSSQRAEGLKKAFLGASRLLILTEGLLVYLDKNQVSDLSSEIRAYAGTRIWLTDLFSRPLADGARRTWAKHLERANAPLKFAPREGAAFFERQGWELKERLSVLSEGLRLKRDFPGAQWVRPFFPLMPRRLRQSLDESYTMIRLEPKN